MAVLPSSSTTLTVHSFRLAPDERDSEGNTIPGFRITYPNAADVSADIKATRTLYIEFVALLAGAIQVVEITGSLTYSYEG